MSLRMLGRAAERPRAGNAGAEEPRVKRLPDGRALLNVGCGFRTHRAWNNVDFSPYAWLAHHRSTTRFLHRAGVLSDVRYQQASGVDPEIVRFDLRKGIPFPDETFHGVYHSHFLEHLDREAAPAFLAECRRVLVRGGVLRVVVPDLERLVERYATSLAALEQDAGEDAVARHEQAVESIFDQMVRREPHGTSRQRPLIRRVERLVRGSTERTGEAHRWLYDRHTLGALLRRTGFRDATVRDHRTSAVPDWPSFGLDEHADGRPWIEGSLYMEAVR